MLLTYKHNLPESNAPADKVHNYLDNMKYTNAGMLANYHNHTVCGFCLENLFSCYTQDAFFINQQKLQKKLTLAAIFSKMLFNPG